MRASTHRTIARLWSIAIAWSLLTATAFAQSGIADDESAADAAGTPPAASETDAPPSLNLGQQMQQIRRDYERFEQKLLELGELMRASDPDRAELLTRTRSQSREQRVLGQMQFVAQLLVEGNELGDAVSRQDEVLAQLQALLELLQSEDARDRNRRDIEAIEAFLKDLNKVIGEQKDTRAATERGGDAEKLQEEQERVAEHARKLAGDIDQRDSERAAEKNSKGTNRDGDSQPSQNPDEPGDDQPSEQPGEDQSQQPGENEPQDSSKSSEAKPSESGSPSQSSSPQPGSPQPGSQQQQPGAQPQPSPGQQSESQQQDGGQQNDDSNSQQTPGRQELEQALREMNQAIEELKQQNQDAASDEQDAALAELQKAKARLEEILRQLREEEREMLLTLLEARFQEMLRVQLQINSETERLDRVPSADRESRHAARATDLARDQRDNALEADRALILLKEEGSSVAFPEAVEQTRDSMITVAERLERTDTGETTQLIEQIIVETLDEMIFALQRELEKLKDQQQQQQQQQQQEQDEPLIRVLAELKMIRSLQNQVNRLTRQIGLDIDGEQADDPNNRKLLRDLARRQERIQEATYDLSTGKTSLGQELRRGSQ